MKIKTLKVVIIAATLEKKLARCVPGLVSPGIGLPFALVILLPFLEVLQIALISVHIILISPEVLGFYPLVTKNKTGK